MIAKNGVIFQLLLSRNNVVMKFDFVLDMETECVYGYLLFYFKLS